MKTVLALFLLLSAISSSCRASDGLGIQKMKCPDYPEIARISRIHGDVHLTVTVEADGMVTAAEIKDGPRILSKSASENVLTWRFSGVTKADSIEVTYSYRLADARGHGPEVPEISVESPTRIVITSRPPLTIEDKITIPKQP